MFKSWRASEAANGICDVCFVLVGAHVTSSRCTECDSLHDGSRDPMANLSGKTKSACGTEKLERSELTDERFALLETIATNSLDLGLKFSYLFGHLFNRDCSNFECICVHHRVNDLSVTLQWGKRKIYH
jgi:hypothetical protein